MRGLLGCDVLESVVLDSRLIAIWQKGLLAIIVLCFRSPGSRSFSGSQKNQQFYPFTLPRTLVGFMNFSLFTRIHNWPSRFILTFPVYALEFQL